MGTDSAPSHVLTNFASAYGVVKAPLCNLAKNRTFLAKHNSGYLRTHTTSSSTAYSWQDWDERSPQRATANAIASTVPACHAQDLPSGETANARGIPLCRKRRYSSIPRATDTGSLLSSSIAAK